MDEDSLIAFCVVALILVAVVLVLNENAWKRRCLANGYPQASYHLIGPNYCIKRVDQTDTVIPEDKVK
jgi:hypothetical protein